MPTDKIEGLAFWLANEDVPEESRNKETYGQGEDQKTFWVPNPTWMKRRATELWGPYGGDWGLRGLTWEHIRDGADKPISVLVLHAEFFCPITNPFGYTCCYPWDPTGTTYRSLHTITLRKCLSLLGIGAKLYQFRDPDSPKEMQHVGEHEIVKRFKDRIAGAAKSEQLDGIIKDLDASGLHGIAYEEVANQIPTRSTELQMKEGL